MYYAKEPSLLTYHERRAHKRYYAQGDNKLVTSHDYFITYRKGSLKIKTKKSQGIVSSFPRSAIVLYMYLFNEFSCFKNYLACPFQDRQASICIWCIVYKQLSICIPRPIRFHQVMESVEDCRIRQLCVNTSIIHSSISACEMMCALFKYNVL